MSKIVLALACLLVVACGEARPSAVTSPSPSVEANATASPPSTTEPSPIPTPTPRFPFPVACGPMDETACERFVQAKVEALARSDPEKTITGITIESKWGSHTTSFSDGTLVAANVDAVPARSAEPSSP